MNVPTLRKEIIERFNYIVRDDSNLIVLGGVFDAMMTHDGKSLVSDEHYKLVKESRRQYLAGETEGATWEEVKNHLKKKHGF